jgi:hypothetical protein
MVLAGGGDLAGEGRISEVRPRGQVQAQQIEIRTTRYVILAGDSKITRLGKRDFCAYLRLLFVLVCCGRFLPLWSRLL